MSLSHIKNTFGYRRVLDVILAELCLMAFTLKCICTHFFFYVKGTQFSSPLQQHSKKTVHLVMKSGHKVSKITGSERTLEKTTPHLHCLQGLRTFLS